MEEVSEFLAIARKIVKFVIENGDNLTKAVKITIQIIKESGELVQMVAHLAREHGPALLQMLKHRTKASLQAAKSGIRALSDQTALVAKSAARDLKQFLQHDVKKHLLHPVSTACKKFTANFARTLQRGFVSNMMLKRK